MTVLTQKPAKRRRNHAPRIRGEIRQLPWMQFDNPLPPVEVLSADQVEQIHHAALTLLSEIGMVMHDPWAREVLARAGCDVDHGEMRVRFDPGFVEEKIALAPKTFTLRARNPERNLSLGGSRINFASVVGPAFCSDLDKGRRTGTTLEVRDFVRLLHMLNTIHFVYGTPFEAMDLAPEVRHLQGYLNGTELSDKVWGSWLLGRYRAEDAIDMACILFDTDRDGLRQAPVCMGNVNTNSPLVLDQAMTNGARAFAECGQAVIVTPFTLAGAMAPSTIAGALTGQNAEALAVIALLQTAYPGTPCVYGSFTSNVDLRSGAPAFGTPEFARASFASGQLARRYGLPWRSSNCCTSNVADAQAAYESEMSIWPTVMSHCNFIIHGGGWLEGGLTASFEKLILDAEMLQGMLGAIAPIETGPAELGLDAFREVGPGGHFFGAQHTFARYETAFQAPLVSDYANFETWSDRGGLTATQRANTLWKQMLREYQAPPLDPDTMAALTAFTKRRNTEIMSGYRAE